MSRQRESVTPSRTVCRNLFGTVNHDEIREELNKQNTRTLQEKRLEYNFDFEREVPLQPGRYLWEKIPNLNRTQKCNKLTTEEGDISKRSNSKAISKHLTKNKSSNHQEEHKITSKLYKYVLLWWLRGK